MKKLEWRNLKHILLFIFRIVFLPDCLAMCALAGKSAVYVDTSNLENLLDSREIERHKFYSGKTAEIIQEKCTSCGLCEGVCRFDAINYVSDNYMIDELSCE